MRVSELPIGMQQQLLAQGIAPNPRRPKRDDKGEQLFAFQCRAMKLPPVSPQYQLARPGVFTPKTRKQSFWVFDFAFPEYSLFVEIDGGIWIQGAHAHPTDITRNMIKQNDATLAGFQVLRFTPAQAKNGDAIAFTQRVLANKGWKR
jgi:hypothetical protein